MELAQKDSEVDELGRKIADKDKSIPGIGAIAPDGASHKRQSAELSELTKEVETLREDKVKLAKAMQVMDADLKAA